MGRPRLDSGRGRRNYRSCPPRLDDLRRRPAAAQEPRRAPGWPDQKHRRMAGAGHLDPNRLRRHPVGPGHPNHPGGHKRRVQAIPRGCSCPLHGHTQRPETQTLRGATEKAKSLGVEGSPGIPVGKTVIGKQMVFGSLGRHAHRHLGPKNG